MKLLFENWRKYILNEEVFSSKEIEQIGPNEITVNTLTTNGGTIVIWEHSPAAGGVHSIYKFVVDEDKRGLGIGSQLIDAVLGEYPGEEISGQVSSLASLKILHNKGFVNLEAPNATFEELIELFNKEGESLNMRLKINS
jgi:GNAT superfamily N-acetyltransferase